MNTISATTITLALALGLSACATEPGAIVDDPIYDDAFAKDLEVTDASGENRVYLTILSHSETELDGINTDSFTVVPLYGASSAGEELGEPIKAPAGNEVGTRMGIVIQGTDFADGVTGFRLTLSEDEDQQFKGWKYKDYYSSEDCVRVERTSFWHRVYVTIKSKSTSTSSWSTMLLERKLNNNEVLNRCKVGSHQLKVTMKYKDTKHFTIEFNE